MRHRLALIGLIITTLLLSGSGCPPAPPTEHPSITVNAGNNVLIISGKGFQSVPLCAHLSMQSGATGPVVVGDPSCSGGGFVNFVFPYSYGACANPKSTTSVSIFAQDPNSNAGASQTIQIPWDTNCVIAKAGCLGAGASCIACGGEGEPVCANNSCVEPDCSYQKDKNGNCVVTLPDLHPDGTQQAICTANCGHTQGYHPCYPYMDGCFAPQNNIYPSTQVAPGRACDTTDQNGIFTQTCYDDSTLDVPSNTCQVQ
jgi:hypothetical protein